MGRIRERLGKEYIKSAKDGVEEGDLDKAVRGLIDAVELLDDDRLENERRVERDEHKFQGLVELLKKDAESRDRERTRIMKREKRQSFYGLFGALSSLVSIILIFVLIYGNWEALKQVGSVTGVVAALSKILTGLNV